MGLFSKGEPKFSCNRDKVTGKLFCKSFRENKDGTREILASLIAEQTAEPECEPVIVEAEGRAEDLKTLEEFAYSKMKRGCQSKNQGQKPEDY